MCIISLQIKACLFRFGHSGRWVHRGASMTAAERARDPPQQVDDDGDEAMLEMFGLPPGALNGASLDSDEMICELKELEHLVAEGADVARLDTHGFSSCRDEVLRLARLILQGRYVEALQGAAAGVLIGPDGKATLSPEVHIAEELIERVMSFVRGDAESDMAPRELQSRSTEALFVGVALLNVYLQANYTGPALTETDLCGYQEVLRHVAAKAHGSTCLEVDGEEPYHRSLLPEALAAARAILHALALPRVAPWSAPVGLSKEGKVHLEPNIRLKGDVGARMPKVETAALWSARAAVIHRRLLPGRRQTPRLWVEVQTLFKPLLDMGLKGDYNEEKGPDDWATIMWLEWGLAQHHFQEDDDGKKAFQRAKEAAKLELTLTAAMGRRTKYQEKDLPQMVLVAKSSRPIAEATGTSADLQGEDASSTPSFTVPHILPHAQDSVLLEKTAFADSSLESQSRERLYPLEQAVILAICLDVANSNPHDGLTSEEIAPYVQRVLTHPSNWMVNSTALLQRCWLDFESSYAQDRALLQMQALVDQHGVRSTPLQSSTSAVEESSPVQDRLRYLHCILYPPQWELKRDLAERYAKMGVVATAAEMFLELGMWDEVVQCYQVQGRLAQAESLVRERLAIGETPVMWAALGDLTSDAECYRKAWELSGRRFARAKRSLGRMAFRERNFEAAIEHFNDSLRLVPLVPDVWFLLGLANMALERFPEALAAFTRVVQQEGDDGRAWGNIGAINLRLGNFEKALAALREGVRCQRESPEMWDNLLTCAAKLERWHDVIYATHRLIDIRRAQGQGPKAWTPDVFILNLLVQRAIIDVLPQAEGDPEYERAHASMRKQVGELLGRATSVVTTDPKLWEVYARFSEAVGKLDAARDYATRACRSLVNKHGWEKEERMVKEVVDALESLAQLHLRQPTVTGLHQCEMFLRAPLKKLSDERWAGSEEQIKVEELSQRLKEALAACKAVEVAPS